MLEKSLTIWRVESVSNFHHVSLMGIVFLRCQIVAAISPRLLRLRESWWPGQHMGPWMMDPGMMHHGMMGQGMMGMIWPR